MKFGSFIGILAVAIGTALPAFAQQKNGENAITAPVGGQIPAGQNLEIKWNPTTKGTVSLVLIKGAPGALQEVLPIIANHPNSGTFSWAPPKELQGMQTMGADQGYSIKVIDDATKNFNEGALFKLDNADSTFAGGAAESKPPGEATTPPAGETNTAPPAGQTTAPADAATTPATAPPTPPTSEATPATEPAPPTSAEVPPTTLETAAASTPVTSDPAAVTSADSTSTATSASSTADSDSSKSSESASSTASASPAPAKKISTATIIGIAAAVVVFVVAAVVGVMLLMRRRRVNRESKMFGGTADPLNLRNSGYKPQTSYDSEFAMMERQRPYAEFRETGPYASQNAPPQPEHIGMARI